MELSQISLNDTGTAGGKGASLGEMIKAGIPVPDGFVILTEAFDRFIDDAGIREDIHSALDRVRIKDIHTVESASKAIRAMILSCEMPYYISKEIIRFYKKMNMSYVAVRSSSPSEDSASAAWAGQLESYVNTTEHNLTENVRKCWASLFSPRAIFYMHENKSGKGKISMAVVVQKMVESGKSGIAFSVHPVTGDAGQIIIEAGFGLGEAVVSGKITPDSYLVDKQDCRILDIKISSQDKALNKSKIKGNIWKPLGKKGKKQVLAGKEIIMLAWLVKKIESYFRYPVDIEWAVEKGRFYILQSRPVTTLAGKKAKTQM